MEHDPMEGACAPCRVCIGVLEVLPGFLVSSSVLTWYGVTCSITVCILRVAPVTYVCC